LDRKFDISYGLLLVVISSFSSKVNQMISKKYTGSLKITKVFARLCLFLQLMCINALFRLILLFSILTLGTLSSPGQSRDTIYLDQDYERVFRGDHQYYRVVDSVSKSKFIIRDYYYSGALKTEARSKTSNANEIKGTVKHYYESGGLQRASKYKNPQAGTATYYSEEGKKISRVPFKDGQKVGTEVFFGKNGKKIGELKYVDGIPFEGIIPVIQRLTPDQYFNFIGYELGGIQHYYKYYNNGQLAMKVQLTNGDWRRENAVFYDPKGHLVGNCQYQDNAPIEGHCLEFYEEYLPGISPASIKYKTVYQSGEIQERWSYNYFGTLIGHCTYREGRPFSGTVLEGNVAMSYQNGGIEGKVTTYNPAIAQIKYEYNLVQGVKQGPTSYFCSETDSIYIGSYQDGLPHEGFVLVDKELCFYSDGYRNGLCLQYNQQGAIHIISHFKNGARNGLFEFRGHSELGPIIGIYQNNRPYEGYFTDRRFSPTIKQYLAGKLIEEKLYNPGPLRLAEHKSYSDDGQLSRKTIYDDSQSSGYQIIFEEEAPKLRATFEEGQFTEGCTEEIVKFNKNAVPILAKICRDQDGTNQIVFKDQESQIEIQILLAETIQWGWPLNLETFYIDQFDRAEKCYLIENKKLLFHYQQSGATKIGSFVRPVDSRFLLKGANQESTITFEELKKANQQ